MKDPYAGLLFSSGGAALLADLGFLTVAILVLRRGSVSVGATLFGLGAVALFANVFEVGTGIVSYLFKEDDLDQLMWYRHSSRVVAQICWIAYSSIIAWLLNKALPESRWDEPGGLN